MAKGVTIDLIVDPKKAVEGIGQVERKASGASEAIGNFASVAAGAVAGLPIAAAAGAAALGAAVIKGFAEYEQLAGGVQKLFGDSASTVAAFAANAAQTAGLSANRYMETVTSFSAALISGLGGDQEAAARYADMAITDMADNANTFGTSIESVQLAYQGFAKGQFTLLDNLKLGYGGTQAEMARLINDSGVLAGAMDVTAESVKDVPFDVMIQAIHRVQEGMGIAGTTAREAAATIQGSFDATKASLDNLVVGMGRADADFETLVGNVASNAQNLVNNVGPVLERAADSIPMLVPVLVSAIEGILPSIISLGADLISSILSGILNSAPKLVEGAIPVVLNLVQGIVEMLPQMLAAGLTILLSLIQGLSAAIPLLIPVAVKAISGLAGALLDNLPLILDAAVDLVIQLAMALVQNLPEIIETGIELVLGLALGIVDAIPQLISALPELINALLSGLLGAIPQLVMAGVKLIVALVENLPAIIEGIISIVPAIVDAIVKTFGDPKFWKQMGEAGMQLIRGLWEGIKGMGDWLWRQIKKFFGDVIDNIKKLFGIRSPSTVFAGFGEYMIEGLEKGLTGPNNLKPIMSDLSSQVTKGFQGSLDADVRATVATNTRANVAPASSNGGLSVDPEMRTLMRTLISAVDHIEPGRIFPEEVARTTHVGDSRLAAIGAS